MQELSRHIGEWRNIVITISVKTGLIITSGDNTDIPAGDIGTGGREIGFMFGAYKKCRNGEQDAVSFGDKADQRNQSSVEF